MSSGGGGGDGVAMRKGFGILSTTLWYPFLATVGYPDPQQR